MWFIWNAFTGRYTYDKTQWTNNLCSWTVHCLYFWLDLPRTEFMTMQFSICTGDNLSTKDVYQVNSSFLMHFTFHTCYNKLLDISSPVIFNEALLDLHLLDNLDQISWSSLVIFDLPIWDACTELRHYTLVWALVHFSLNGLFSSQFFHYSTNIHLYELNTN